MEAPFGVRDSLPTFGQRGFDLQIGVPTHKTFVDIAPRLSAKSSRAACGSIELMSCPSAKRSVALAVSAEGGQSGRQGRGFQEVAHQGVLLRWWIVSWRLSDRAPRVPSEKMWQADVCGLDFDKGGHFDPTARAGQRAAGGGNCSRQASGRGGA